MTEAVVIGENHASKKDWERLLNVDLSDFDAVFREGHERKSLDQKLEIGEALFRIGRLVFIATLGRLYQDSGELEEKVRDSGTPLFDEIDASVREHYGLVARWKKAVILLVSPFVPWFVLGPVVSVPLVVLPFALQQTLTTVMGVAVVFFQGFLWALFYFVFVAGEAMAARDDWMTENIVDKVEQEGYDRVMISCGGRHRSGIAENLREEGWQVKEEGSQTLLGKIRDEVSSLANSLTDR